MIFINQGEQILLDLVAALKELYKPYRRLSKRGIQREIGMIAYKTGLQDKVSPHVLRYKFATLTFNNGAEIVAIQELLGHSSPDTTLKYARLLTKKREQHKRHLIQLE
ncbi:hypothetical protein A8F94_14160 [Bacillus sp. FJAT-27225]|uniref:tyrosine-type recombinase/integrase n=1 Tax=Bacillus sp. FJAT-27225 TaxID=1743144 RepID=UPI00080C3390|nr:tyrosine-type recombinase/integrase [Bacillus sp. FJAT-27225]OCA85986.1 hypothetical protein A8F94_14160 [Bacillus sp. FJAT-27225]